jgi:hypothetical protein
VPPERLGSGAYGVRGWAVHLPGLRPCGGRGRGKRFANGRVATRRDASGAGLRLERVTFGDGPATQRLERGHIRRRPCDTAARAGSHSETALVRAYLAERTESGVPIGKVVRKFRQAHSRAGGSVSDPLFLRWGRTGPAFGRSLAKGVFNGEVARAAAAAAV